LGISIILADHHPIVRRGLKALFECEPVFSIMAVASDGDETLRLAERLRPDVLVLDLMMPGLGGSGALHTLRDRAPNTRTIIFSRRPSRAAIGQALRSGAAGFVFKGGPEEHLVRAVKEAHAGGHFLSPPLSTVAAVSLDVERSNPRALDSPESLTSRQRQVLQLALQGKTSAETGAVLNISPRTVENHRAMLMNRLGLKNQTELVYYAIQRGLISPNECLQPTASPAGKPIRRRRSAQRGDAADLAARRRLWRFGRESR
jgi:two-component system, NarL family, response regulator NreC